MSTQQGLQRLQRFAEAKYTAFISYSHRDNEATNGWIADFAKVLAPQLDTELSTDARRLNKLVEVHRSGQNGRVHGVLDERMQEAIAQSFAMVVVVHKNYLDSKICHDELRWFKDRFGDEGLRERLFIVALSETCMTALEASDLWKDIFEGQRQLWHPFYSNDDKTSPMTVYRPDGERATAPFFERFKPLRNQLAEKINADARNRRELPREPFPSSNVMSGRTRTLLIAPCRPELDAAVKSVAERLKRRDPDLSVQVLTQPPGGQQIKSADYLLLPFNNGAPLDWPHPQGHFGQLKQGWETFGKPADNLLTLDLREISAPDDASAEFQETLQWLTSCSGYRKSAEVLEKPFIAEEKFFVGGQAVIYVENNPNESQVWDAVGDRLQELWKTIPSDKRPPLLKTLSLHVQEERDLIHKLAKAKNAHGVVLLWGKKDSEALRSQIEGVESLEGPVLPGMVAHLSPPKPKADQPVGIDYWPATRWVKAAGAQAIRFDPADEDVLGRFVLRVAAIASAQQDSAGAGSKASGSSVKP